jgi:glycogen(starch) synthase
MRLLFLSNLYPPFNIGGNEQLCQEIAECLRQRGHTVRVLTSRYGLNHTVLPEQDVIRRLHLQANVNYYRPSDFFLKRTHQERSNERELRLAIDQLGPDLVVVWGMWNLSRNLPYWAEQWMPGRVAYYISSYWPMDTDIHIEYWASPTKRPMSELIKRPLRDLALSQLRREGYPHQLGFEHVMCCSQYVKDTLVQAGKVPASAGVLFLGIDPEPFLRFSPTTKEVKGEPLRLSYFGSLLPHKGIHTAIKALGLLKQRGLANRVELTILGSGHPDYEALLRRLVTQLGVEDRVHFAGRVLRDEIPAWLGRFDVFLFTSVWAEPMARSVIEAMAAGLLVIGTEVGGQVEMLANEENGLTFQPEDAETLANHIERVLSDRALLHQLALGGRQMVLERFTLKRMVDDIETWLTSIVASRLLRMAR